MTTTKMYLSDIKKTNEQKVTWLLTLFLQVTWIRYLVSGHKDSSTFDDCVNRFPIKPPPLTSHVTKQSLGDFVAVHAMFVDTNELSRTIDWTDSDQVSKMDLFMLVDEVHSSQHCKKREKSHLSVMHLMKNLFKNKKKKIMKIVSS